MLRKISSDFRMMRDTLLELPFATQRALGIVAVSLVVIGVLVFWPDIMAVILFSVMGTLLMCSLVTLGANDVTCPPIGEDAWDDDEADV